MNVTVEVTEADYEAACLRRFGKAGWAELKLAAYQAAASRLIQDNLQLQREICDALPSLTGAQWMAKQQEFTDALTKHEALLKIAYPQEASGG